MGFSRPCSQFHSHSTGRPGRDRDRCDCGRRRNLVFGRTPSGRGERTVERGTHTDTGCRLFVDACQHASGGTDARTEPIAATESAGEQAGGDRGSTHEFHLRPAVAWTALQRANQATVRHYPRRRAIQHSSRPRCQSMPRRDKPQMQRRRRPTQLQCRPKHQSLNAKLTNALTGPHTPPLRRRRRPR